MQWWVGVLDDIVRVIYILLVARMILTWVPGLPVGDRIKDAIYRSTEVVLDPIRRILPPMGGLDLSPMVTMLAIGFIHRLILTLLRG